ncbi:MAG TPA: glycogen/starch/alpha-glucan phosphorylase [Methylomusa anaerophila]|uniref:Alpha-1,4 glucan phosphorylase n=1 Tax=Methylomusa anaerophila TaxID=1930071 RepID=A0A348AJ49_9FIRM|nr:glycogen/starch/alpha-glucan phosphorylase [Methylomusa anaerophila]BBB91097.1 glycogen phosphorylase [Methylomusa anaerophila]HML88974.1 glycogen/starch/alpha-glucan phosphorylase [Methylomusa anaerophila]
MLTDKEQFKAAFVNRLLALHRKTLEEASLGEKYDALASLVRDSIGRRWVNTDYQYAKTAEKQLYYFSIEFLPGRLLDQNLRNIGVRDLWVEALNELGLDYGDLENQEPDAGLGNGGLGRLAACFLDSMAALGLPGHGCGIRYQYGLFEQKIIDGNQIEQPDNWMKNFNLWEYRREDKAVKVKFGGHLNTVLAVPYDLPIIGFANNTVNTLRLWSAELPRDLTVILSSLTPDDANKAVQHKYSVEALSQILYPDDRYQEGRTLRLAQEYFLVSAGVQSIVRYVKKTHGGITHLAEKAAIHINDTHPALAIPELMRILMDDEGLGWEDAWRITANTFSYTNHTVMPEALEKWPVDTVQNLLPRIYEIIHEINERFCRELWKRYPGDWDRIAAMAVTAYGYVKMAHLAVVGSHSVNGVSKIHTEILKQDVLKLFYQHAPSKFNNKTNGINHRRWLVEDNPQLSRFITETIGDNWIFRPVDLGRLTASADNPEFQQKLKAIKRERKIILARYINGKYGVEIDVNSIFDVQIKRIHAYKRQLLNALRIIDLYDRLKANPDLDVIPRTFIFAGKAAPGYVLAKKVIKLINTLAKVINNDAAVNNKIKVVFIENYGVSLAEIIIPAADVSEQISTAGTEASGTSNMKLMMNGALTVGTMDGANIEIKEAVGIENIIPFGLSVEEIISVCGYSGCDPRTVYNNNPRVRQVVDRLVDGTLPFAADEFHILYDHLVYGDGHFMELNDFDAFLAAQEKVDILFRDEKAWWKIITLNISKSGLFSSDYTVNEYARHIWRIRPVEIKDKLESPVEKVGDAKDRPGLNNVGFGAL